MIAFAALFLLIMLAFFSSTEAALFSLSRYQFRRLKELYPDLHQRVRLLLQDPSGSLLTLLVMSEIANVSFSTLMAHQIERWMEQHAVAQWIPLPHWALLLGASVLLTTPIVLLLGEVIPKSLAVRTNQWQLVFSARILVTCYRVLAPIRLPVRRFLAWLSHQTQISGGRPGGAEIPELAAASTEEELLALVQESQKEGELHQNEAQLIKNTLSLDDTEVRRIATPFGQAFSISPKTTVAQALERVRSRPFSRIPIVDREARPHIVHGILYKKDLIDARFEAQLDPARLERPITELMRPAVFLPETQRAHLVFRSMREQRVHLVVLVNAERQPTGVVTLNDILEDLFEGLEARQ